jgi:hypothetical protein
VQTLRAYKTDGIIFKMYLLLKFLEYNNYL